MAGDFDFDKDERPAPRPRRDDRDDRDDDPDPPPARRRGYTPTGRRPAGRASFSVGGFVTIGGALLALLALFVPIGYLSLRKYNVAEYGPIWAAGAAAVGGVWLRVRTVRFPGPADYGWSGAGLVAGLVFGVLLVVVGFAIMNNDRIAAGMTGGKSSVWVYVLILAGAVVAGGAVFRFVEQFRRWGKDDEADEPRRRDDEEDDRPRRRAEREDEEDDRPRSRRRRDDEEPPRPPARRRPPRDDHDD